MDELKKLKEDVEIILEQYKKLSNQIENLGEKLKRAKANLSKR
ncbi:hypothetical protein [Peribacillus tepidiphilus]|jgi:uncharacterized protein YaaN involved in tellurite resistance